MFAVQREKLLPAAAQTATGPRSTDESFKIVSATDGIGIAEVGSVCLVVWCAPVVRERFLRQRDALDEISARHDGRAGFVIVTAPDLKPPEDVLRKASIEMIAALRDRLTCIACVIEGGGFRAAVTRSVLSGIVLLLPKSKTSVKFFASVAAAGHWVSPRCNGLTTASLCEAEAQLRTRLASG